MNQLLKPAAVILFIVSAFIFSAFTNSPGKATEITKPKNANPKIQVAILLDVSGSMDGLIEQAKAQLWNMVNTMGQDIAEYGGAFKITEGKWLNFTICFEKHEMLYGWQIRCPDEETYYEVKAIMEDLL